MALKLLEGMRTHTTSPDISPQVITAPNTVNGGSHDMREHLEFLATVLVGATTSNVLFIVEESNEAAANFVAIPSANAVFTGSDDDETESIVVNWRNPARKRYVRITASTVGGTSGTVAAVGHAIGSHLGDLDAGNNITEID